MSLTIPRAARVIGRETCGRDLQPGTEGNCFGFTAPTSRSVFIINQTYSSYLRDGAEACAGFSVTAGPVGCVNEHQKEKSSVRRYTFANVQVHRQCKNRTGNMTRREKRLFFNITNPISNGKHYSSLELTPCQ